MINSRRATLGVLVVVALLVVCSAVWLSGDGMFFGWLLFVVLGGWVLLGVFLVGSAIIQWTGNGSWGRWGLVSAISSAALLTSVVLGVLGVPERVRLELSRAGLREAGRAVLAGDRPTRAGLYTFEATSIMDGCALMETPSMPLFVDGWAYCPSKQPASIAFESVGGDLYRYSFGD